VVIFSADGARVGGFGAQYCAGDTARSEVEESKIIAKAKSEAKHRKRSLFMTVQSLPQTPLDNHMPNGVQFL